MKFSDGERDPRIGDRVYFCDIDYKGDYDNIGVFVYAGTITSIEPSGYVCKPNDGTARYIPADLVAPTYDELRPRIVANLESEKRRQMNRFNRALSNIPR